MRVNDCVSQDVIFNKELRRCNIFDNDILGEIHLYEVIRIMEGSPFFLLDHYERLVNSVREVGYVYPYTIYEIEELITKLVSVSGVINGNIEIIYSPDEDAQYIYVKKHSYPTDDMYETGVKVEGLQVSRTNPNVKAINAEYLNIVNQARSQSDAFELLIIDDDGYVTEGSKSNFFFIRDGICYTTVSELVLKGITRKNVIAAIEKLGIELKYGRYTMEDIMTCDAAFLCGTSLNILPISMVNDVEIDSSDNNVLSKIMHAYDELIIESINFKKED